LRARPNPDAQGHFICDEGRYGYHFTNSTERFLRPVVVSEGKHKPTPWNVISPQVRQAFAKAVEENPKLALGVLSPFLTVEEAFLFATFFKSLSKDVKLALGPVPVVGEDDKYPKDLKGNPVEPTKFVIRAEKCPNRRGVEAVLKHFQGSVIPFAEAAADYHAATWFAGGYPDKQQLASAIPLDWKIPDVLVVQDLFPSLVSESASFILPGTSAFEKDGTFVNHAGLAQTFARAVRPPTEVRSELQLAFDMLGRRGLVQAHVIRAELAKAVPFFAGLETNELPPTGVRFELPTV
jgi:NADH-quinone oxidoreductase subunit G